MGDKNGKQAGCERAKLKPAKARQTKSKVKQALDEQQLSPEQLLRLQQRIGYTFQHPELLRQALRHRSLASPNNERLEFLGDALLGAITAEQLFNLLPKASEGALSRSRTTLVSGENLAILAERFGIEQLLQFAPSDLRREDLTTRHRSLLADAIEAMIGAIFLDNLAADDGDVGCDGEGRRDLSDRGSGWVSARRVVASWLQDQLTGAKHLNVKDAKTRLQEWLQERRLPLPEYGLVQASGPDHAKIFQVECRTQWHDGECLIFMGSGYNKRAAEQEAASAALQALAEKVATTN